MDNKLTYKLKDIISKNRYTEVMIKEKQTGKELEISNACIRFRYEPKADRSYLCFGDKGESSICEVQDENINEVMINNESLSIETNEKNYYCYINKEKLYY